MFASFRDCFLAPRGRWAQVLLVCVLLPVGQAIAQPLSDGAIRGIVRDEQGGILKGATLTAASPDAPGTYSANTDSDGTYRLLNLPPGNYSVTAEYSGFAPSHREDIQVRAGLTLALDISMRLDTRTEDVQVHAESPMLETRTATTALNISGDLQRSLPLSNRRQWSDVLWLTPGAVNNDLVGTPAFFVNGADFKSHVIQLDGAEISAGVQGSASYVLMSSDVLQDVQLKTAGVDASTALGQGAVINMVTRSGTNNVQGALTLSGQARSWSGNNNPGGTTSAYDLVQPEAVLGGPILRDRSWAFGSFRRLQTSQGISRTATQLTGLRAVLPSFDPFDNETTSNQVFVKSTTQFSPNQRLEVFDQYGTSKRWQLSATDTVKSRQLLLGGTAASAQWLSVWSGSQTTRVGFSYSDQSSPVDLAVTDKPGNRIFSRTIASGGRLSGSGALATLDNFSSAQGQDNPATKLTLTADWMFHKSTERLGTHELQAGAYLQPRRLYEFITTYANNGYIAQESVLRDPSNPAAGYINFHRRIYDTPTATSIDTNSSDYAGYIQDSWSVSRATITGGLRIDKIHRRDRLFGVDVQDTTAIGPRIGANLALTEDKHNIARASWGRVHEAVSTGSGLGVGTNSPGFRDEYDTNLDGVFDKTFVTPPVNALLTSQVIDLAGYRQPHVNELTLGYTRQLPRMLSVDFSFIRREFRDRVANIDVNGVYENGLFRGYRDEIANEIYQITSNTYNYPVYSALALQVIKQSANLRVIGSYTRQFRHLEGTWQSNDPAKYIQPTAFPNDKGLGYQDDLTLNSLSGSDMASSEQWRDNVLRLAASYIGPLHITVATLYTLQSGPWSGPIVTDLGHSDPQFGPDTLTLGNGRVVSNPLATSIRFAYPTRGDGQIHLPYVQTWNIRVGRETRIRHAMLDVGLDFLNVMNRGAFYLFDSDANLLNSSTFGAGTLRQPPRSVTFVAHVRF